MHGWGLSGGVRHHKPAKRHRKHSMHGGSDGSMGDYESEIKKAVYGHGIKDGQGMIPSHMIKGGHMQGMHLGYSARYPGSFPMPGFYPAEPMMTEAKRMNFIDGIGTVGQGLSGGGRRMKHMKSPAKVAAGKKAASENPWLKKIAAYRQEHGVSQKQAMIALGRK